MDYLYASHSNERIAQGAFPHCKMNKSDLPTDTLLNVVSKSNRRLLEMCTVPEHLSEFVHVLSVLSDAMVPLLDHKHFEAPFNLILNTGFEPKFIDLESPTYQEAIQLCPAVTKLDKALWILISEYGAQIMLTNSEDKEDLIGKFFAFCYFFDIFQKNEFAFGRTLDLSSIEPNDSQLLKILLGPWDGKNPSVKYFDLSPGERLNIDLLTQKRQELKKQLQQEIDDASKVAAETETEWDMFLDVFNYYAQQEANAVSQICNKSLDPTEKLEAIKTFLTVSFDVVKGSCTINGVDIKLEKILSAVEKRIQHAPAHCLVSDNSGCSFRLHSYAVNLLMAPITFNYLLLCYHQFRLEPTKENALLFSTFALHCLKCNLLTAEELSFDSLEEIIPAVYQEFLNFIDKHGETIDSLSYDDVQFDSVFIGNASLSMVAKAEFRRYLTQKIESIAISSQHVDSSLLDESQLFFHTKEQVDAALVAEQKNAKNIKEKAVAQQVVSSLNILFLFCDALRLMNDKNHIYLYFDSAAEIDYYNSALARETSLLTARVYSAKAKIGKYRLDKGIDYRTLADHEKQAEDIKIVSYIDIILDNLEEIEECVDHLDIDGLIQLKSKLRNEIQSCDIRSLTDRFSERFISISSRICNRLVNLCRSTINDFENAKQQLLDNLGECVCLLPPSVLNSLTTAELLYHQYASEAFAEKGFDYSCISALYYQAFEEAYNTLIWREYANEVNDLQKDGQTLAQILKKCKKAKDPTILTAYAPGYLPNDFSNRVYYLNKKQSAVQTSRTYGEFGALLEKFFMVDSEMYKFCEHFAKIAGFTSSEEMFNNSKYITSVTKFTADIKQSAQNRNNASHGGNIISFNQCTVDKHTILSELESLRADSIGLIQQLLGLLKNTNALPTYEH